ncbi:MAG: hypothetical protein IKS35_05865 [Clostridia bacterium]|nr:hypothetical protein [Clostridia bacterium]
MMEEPRIFCPECGEQAIVIEWFEYDPRKIIGYAKCAGCGTLDFKILNRRIITMLQPDPEETGEIPDDRMVGLSGYEPELAEDLPAAGLA